MESTLPALELAARRAYERARLRRAFLGALPIAGVVAFATVATTQLLPTVGAAALLVTAGVIALWWGNGFQRALLAGLLAGLFPLVSIVCAARFGHLCFGSACTSVCLASSAVGGLGAGVIVGSRRLHRRVRGATLAAAAGFAVITGAMGTTCVGLRGFALFVAGFSAAFAVQWLKNRASPAAQEAP